MLHVLCCYVSGILFTAIDVQENDDVPQIVDIEVPVVKDNELSDSSFDLVDSEVYIPVRVHDFRIQLISHNPPLVNPPLRLWLGCNNHVTT